VFTGANELLLFDEFEPKLGGLIRVRTEASARTPGITTHIETDALRPALRGRGLDAWSFNADRRVLWLYDDVTCKRASAPKRTERFLARHAAKLEARTGWKPNMERGALFRVTPDTTRAKVAWHDLASNLNAVALPARVLQDGAERALVPLNTVYFIPVDSSEQALIIAALLNSLPVRTYARAIAERAKDAHFRFFAWVIGILPLPARWSDAGAMAPLLCISRAAHAAGFITPAQQVELDRGVAALYGLDGAQLDVLASFDRWLRGIRDT
jgi:hypothetical protein